MKYYSKSTDLSSDPLTVFENLVSGHENCFLLETLADKHQPVSTNRSYIGVSPSHHFSAAADCFYVDGHERSSPNPFTSLRQQLSLDKTLPPDFVGGLVGYFTHEGVHHIEHSLEFPYKRAFPDFEYGLYNDGLVFKNDESPDYFYYDGSDRSSIYHAVHPQPNELKIKHAKTAKNKTRYTHMINTALDDIKNGRVFQVVLANQYTYHFSGDLIHLYKELCKINRSPFMFFLKFGNTITLGASPELLVRTKPSGDVYLEALAGTIRRGNTAKEDAELATQLLADDKEIAEHSMLIDLARNDMGRISQIGSVHIDDLMFVKKMSHVQHISSIISGRLRPGLDAFDALAATFPSGVLSGAPKIEAIKMIRELEGYERGPYGGTVGFFGYNGDSEQAANLRSVNAKDDILFLNSGSGIVYDSHATGEYQEVSDKKAAMDKAMLPFLKSAAS